MVVCSHFLLKIVVVVRCALGFLVGGRGRMRRQQPDVYPELVIAQSAELREKKRVGPTASNVSLRRRLMLPQGLSLKSDAAWIKRSESPMELKVKQ